MYFSFCLIPSLSIIILRFIHGVTCANYLHCRAVRHYLGGPSFVTHSPSEGFGLFPVSGCYKTKQNKTKKSPVNIRVQVFGRMFSVLLGSF